MQAQQQLGTRVNGVMDDLRLQVEMTPDCTIETIIERDPAGLRRRIKTFKRWTPVGVIGEGAYGVVNLEEEAVGGELRAVKKVRKAAKNREEQHDSLRELLAMAVLARDNINFPTFYGWYEDQDHLYFAMEYFEHRDLQAYMDSEGKPLSEKDGRIVCFQVMEALEAIHEKSITHRDVTPKNIFVASNEPNWRVKLGDFGISKRVYQQETALYTRFYGVYVAPEIMGFVAQTDEETVSPYTPAVDIWSLGCISYWLLSLTNLFEPSKRPLWKYCESGKLPDDTFDSPVYSVGVSGFIRSCITVDPNKRPTATEALDQPWLQLIYDVESEEKKRELPESERCQLNPKPVMDPMRTSTDRQNETDVAQNPLDMLSSDEDNQRLCVLSTQTTDENGEVTKEKTEFEFWGDSSTDPPQTSAAVSTDATQTSATASADPPKAKEFSWRAFMNNPSKSELPPNVVSHLEKLKNPDEYPNELRALRNKTVEIFKKYW